MSDEFTPTGTGGFFSGEGEVLPEEGGTSLISRTALDLQTQAVEDMRGGVVAIMGMPDTVDDMEDPVQHAMWLQAQTMNGNTHDLLFHPGQASDIVSIAYAAIAELMEQTFKAYGAPEIVIDQWREAHEMAVHQHEVLNAMVNVAGMLMHNKVRGEDSDND